MSILLGNSIGLGSVTRILYKGGYGKAIANSTFTNNRRAMSKTYFLPYRCYLVHIRRQLRDPYLEGEYIIYNIYIYIYTQSGVILIKLPLL